MLGNIIRQYRMDKGLSLRAFASRCGLSHSYVDMLEKGHDPRNGQSPRPSIDTLIALAKGLEIEARELMAHADHLSSAERQDIESFAIAYREDPLSDLPEHARLCVERFIQRMRHKYGVKETRD